MDGAITTGGDDRIEAFMAGIKSELFGMPRVLCGAMLDELGLGSEPVGELEPVSKAFTGGWIRDHQQFHIAVTRRL
jgi:hypothetical protein